MSTYGQWRPRAELAAEFDREEALAARALDDLRAEQWARPDQPAPRPDRERT